MKSGNPTPSYIDFLNRINEIDNGKKFIVTSPYNHKIIIVGASSNGQYYYDIKFYTHYVDSKFELIKSIRKELRIIADDTDLSILNNLKDDADIIKAEQILFYLHNILSRELVVRIRALEAIIGCRRDETRDEVFKFQGILTEVNTIIKMIYGHNEGVFKKTILTFLKEILETQKNKIDKNLKFNGNHKLMIEGTLQFYFDEITNLEPQSAIYALKAISNTKISLADKELFQSQNIWGEIKEIRKILKHPAPQNKIENYPYFGSPTNPNIVVYKNKESKPSYEKKGLLNLSACSGEPTYVTRDDVANFIHGMIDERINENEKKLDSVLPINDKQKFIIEEHFSKILKLIEKFNPDDIIKVLNASISILTEIYSFKTTAEIECALAIQSIYTHPCPQNRIENDNNFDAPLSPYVVVYKNKEGKPAFERKGLLNLSAYNDENTVITKEAFIDYIQTLVKIKIQQLEIPEKVIESKEIVTTNKTDSIDFINFSKIFSFFNTTNIHEELFEFTINAGKLDEIQHLLNKAYFFGKDMGQLILSPTSSSCSSLEYAAWSGDQYLLELLLSYLSVEKKLIALNQLKNVRDNGIVYGEHLSSIKTLVLTYEFYIKMLELDTHTFSTLFSFAVKLIGGAQRLLPINVLQEFCDKNNLYFANYVKVDSPNFNQPSSRELLLYKNTPLPFSQSSTSPSIGINCLLLRYNCHGLGLMANHRSGYLENCTTTFRIEEWASSDIKFFQSFITQRTTRLNELIHKLENELKVKYINH